MEPRSLKFISQALGASVLPDHPETMVQRICTDSRQVQPGDLFVALAGERFDGHDFLPLVLAKGVAAIVVERDKMPALVFEDSKTPVLAVENTRRALGQLAARYRQDFQPKMMAVAGSNGKTTTKELIAAVLRQKMPTLWSEASFNNDIGVPHTLLRLDSTHQAAVLEAGTNHPGELSPLIQMIQPDYGVITSIGREHLEHFGDLDGVIREEGSLAELLPSTGILFINGDCPESVSIAARSNASVVRIGFGSDNDWAATIMHIDESGVLFAVKTDKPGYDGHYKIPLLGRHQAGNALFAIAVGAQLGVDKDTIQLGLNQCLPAKMRLQMWAANGVRVIDDAYNANADSMLAALDTLQSIACPGRRVAVLGEMAELGAHSEAAHAEVGQKAASMDRGVLFAVGAMAQVMGAQARASGMTQVKEFETVEEASSSLREFLKAGDTVLIKASRAARLERIGDMIRSLH